MSEFEDPVLKLVILQQALNTPNWKRYFPDILDAGIASMADFLETPPHLFDTLSQKIPPIPLDRLKVLQQDLRKIKMQRQNSFSTPLSECAFFDGFAFAPQFTFGQYLLGSSIKNAPEQILKAKTKVGRMERSDLSEHEATAIVLYTQEASDQTSSYYYQINQCLRVRAENLVCMRSALYLIESGLRKLPVFDGIAWRGMNTAPDLNKIIVGNTVCFAGICSATRDKDQTLTFMEIPPQSGIVKKTLFKLSMSKGVSIQKWSRWESEQEVVASFLSRWTVTKVEENHEELFDSIGSYHCDYYIELQQLDNEPLFRCDKKLTGLHLLSKILYDKPENLRENFKEKFLHLFQQLEDATAQGILESLLSSWNYWNTEDKNFTNNSEDEEIFSTVSQFLTGIHSLSDELEKHGINLEKGFEICDKNGIYSGYGLLKNTQNHVERTVADLLQLGFNEIEAASIYDQKPVKQELEVWYKRNNDLGTVDSPKIVSKQLSKFRFKHYIVRDGAMLGLYRLSHLTVNGANYMLPKFRNIINGAMQVDNFAKLGEGLCYHIQYTDFIVAGAMFAVQFGMYSFQLWHGDITLRQYFKSIACSAVAISAGLIGGALVGWFAAAVAGLLGVATGPLGWVALIGAAVGGFVFGGGADYLVRCLTKKFFSDGEEEELNAKRKLYCDALAKLACTPESSMRTIQVAYYEKARTSHPDRCDDEQAATEEFKRIAAAYEIAKNYHEVLDNARKALDIPTAFTLEHLKACRNTAMRSKETKRAYNIARRHLVYNTNKWKRIRHWLDSDKKLKLNDAPLAIEQSKKT